MSLNIAWSISDSIDTKKFLADGANITTPVLSHQKNWFGLYNTFGNVAEMISEKGISKGGGWRSGLEDCRAGKNIPYSKPTAWLGFRCVCVIKN
jgi:formylglycine-generating enzyme required for sulfatase activity